MRVDVFVYVTDPDEFELGFVQTEAMSETVNVDRIGSEVAGLEILGAHAVTIDGVDIIGENRILRSKLSDAVTLMRERLDGHLSVGDAHLFISSARAALS